MTFQFGNNPEYTISVCWNIFSYSGHLALPFTLTWWKNNVCCDTGTGNVFDVAFWILGIRIGLEIWKWKK